MRALSLVMGFLAVLAFGAAVAQTPSDAQDLPIKRVILYKHGVGYFERMGPVEGEASRVLRFKAKDMNDVLKSLTVLDLGKGVVRTIAYDSTRTVDQQLGEYTFDLRAAQGLPAILDQMKGSEVKLSVGQTPLAGRLLAVEKRSERVEGGTAERYRLSVLLPDATVKSYDLSDVSEVQFTNPRLQKELEKYLETLFSRHRRDEKQVTILSSGAGKRDLFVSYVQEQPVWKVSYRIVASGKEKPLLQAWAIVDNVSPEDWENVELSLVSGLPVSFVQNLYDPFFVRRREIALQRETAVGPVISAAGELMETAGVARRAPAAAPAPALQKARSLGRAEGMADMAVAAPAAPPRPAMYEEMGRQTAQAVAQETGALFVYKIKDPVTIRRDRSALLPIANARVDGERVALYNESVRRDNPMDALRLKNTTGLTLEGGPITVIEENTYVGEALTDTIKPDDERYISFAVDLGTRVDPKHEGGSETLFKVAIAHGVLTRHVKVRETKTYALTNLEDKAKSVLIEHPRRPEWELTQTPPPREKTPDHYRFQVKLDPKQKQAFKVVEEMTTQSEYGLIGGVGKDDIRFFVSQKLIDEKTRAFLESLLVLQNRIAELTQKIEEAKTARQSITQDQTRLRSNLQALGQTEDERNLRSRIVKQLNQQEDRMEALAKAQKETEGELTAKQAELEKLVEAFAFETPAK